MITLTDTVLNEMASCIVKAVDPDEIIVFGSAAHGAGHESSDVDLVVIERQPFGPHRSRRQELLTIRHALSSFRIPKDILLYSADEARLWSNAKHHILAQALHEGRRLYARP